MRALGYLLFFPALSLAHSQQNLIGKLPGKWHGERVHNRGVQIKPDKVHFRFCRPAKVTDKGQITEDHTDHLGYHIMVHPISLYGRGPDYDASCLPKGHHDCLFTVGFWDSHPGELFLDVTCDGEAFQYSFKRRNWR